MRETQARLVHAKALRTRQTDAEIKLWSHLRGHRLNGYKFKRQARLASFIVDFACLEARLIIELDGSQHLESEADQHRDRMLLNQGYRVLRFWNDAVLKETEAVLEVILAALDAAPLPNPSPAGGRGAKPHRP